MKIIRTRQRPFLVVIDVLMTAVAWAGLLYLLIEGLLPMFEPHERPQAEAPVFAALGTLQVYCWVALLNALILISWARYQHRKSKSFPHKRLPAPVVDDNGLIKSFKINGDRLEKLRQPGSMTIHNNAEGDVSHVVTHFYRVDPGHSPAPMALPEQSSRIRLPVEDDDPQPIQSH